MIDFTQTSDKIYYTVKGLFIIVLLAVAFVVIRGYVIGISDDNVIIGVIDKINGKKAVIPYCYYL